MEKQIETLRPVAPTDEDFSCVYCWQKGHNATKYQQNTHCNTSNSLCTSCGRRGHHEEFCWSKGKHNGDRKVRFSAARIESREEQEKRRRRAGDICSQFSEQGFGGRSQELFQRLGPTKTEEGHHSGNRRLLERGTNFSSTIVCPNDW